MTKMSDHATNLGIGAVTPEALENMMFFMAQGLKQRKTRVLERSSMAVGGEGAAGSGNLVKQRFGIQT